MSSGKKNIPYLKSRVLSLSRSAIYTTLFMLIVISWDILHGQARRSPFDVVGQVPRPVPTPFVGTCPPSVWRKSDSSDIVGQTVPSGVGEGGTVPIRISPLLDVDNAQTLNPILDSLDLRLLQIEIAKAEARMTETGFWPRIIPQVHISASFGMHDIMFVDPATFTTYILPRDAYRLTISLSLNDVFSSSRHTQAVLELERLRTEESLLTMKQLHSRKSLEHQLLALRDQAELLQKEMSLIQQLLHFNELRFQQGKIEFDALIRSKLELTSAMKSIMHIHQQEALILLKLTSGDPQ
jgi:hypothetical protein